MIRQLQSDRIRLVLSSVVQADHLGCFLFILMNKDLRDSTVAKSKELEKKLKQRERESQARKSRKLIQVTDRNKASIDEALKLSVITSSESTDTSDKDTNTEEDISGQSQEEFWYDTSNTDLIGVVESPVTPASTSQQDPESWSLANRFLPEGCVLSRYQTWHPRWVGVDCRLLVIVSILSPILNLRTLSQLLWICRHLM